MIENCEIVQTTNTKFLGVIIDEKLTWSQHITQVSLKLSKNIGVLNRLKYSVSKSILLMLYNTLVLPYLSYCNIIWASTYKTHIQKVVILQKRALRVITLSKYNAHTKPLFLKLNLLNVIDFCNFQMEYSCFGIFISYCHPYLITILVLIMKHMTNTRVAHLTIT